MVTVIPKCCSANDLHCQASQLLMHVNLLACLGSCTQVVDQVIYSLVDDSCVLLQVVVVEHWLCTCAQAAPVCTPASTHTLLSKREQDVDLQATVVPSHGLC